MRKLTGTLYRAPPTDPEIWWDRILIDCSRRSHGLWPSAARRRSRWTSTSPSPPKEAAANGWLQMVEGGRVGGGAAVAVDAGFSTIQRDGPRVFG
jgi:hypothetical protein